MELETSIDPGPLPDFQAGPLCRVELNKGARVSLTDAQALADALLRQISGALLPVPDWHWEREPQAEPPCAVETLYAPFPGPLPNEAFEDYPARRARSKGFVQLRADGLYHAWYRPGDGPAAAAEQCGITNDLNDAKWLVAEAWRERLAVSVYAGETACKVDL
jgi:hypothetical protein